MRVCIQKPQICEMINLNTEEWRYKEEKISIPLYLCVQSNENSNEKSSSVFPFSQFHISIHDLQKTT